MLNIGKLAPGQQAYYLSIASGVEDYYVGHGEPPGRWFGRGSATVGLAGHVAEEDLTAVLEARHPGTGEQLSRARVPGFDLAFRAPKSVSLVYGLGKGHWAMQVVQAHDEAVAAAVAYLEDNACFSRRRIDGVIGQVRGEGLIVAGFRHQTSRAGDPTLHTHALVANATRTGDGRWGALDSRSVYKHAKTAGFLYQAHLRWELTRRLGLKWEPVTNGYADVAGIPREAVEGFSTRRAEIIERMAERGEHSAKAAQAAALDTRRAKDYEVDVEQLRREWAERGAGLGFGQREMSVFLRRHHQHRPERPEPSGLFDALASPTGVTEHVSTFDRRAALRSVAERLPEGAPVADIEQLADGFLEEGRVVPLGRSDGRAGVVDTPDGKFEVMGAEARFTTTELLEVERRLVDRSFNGRDAGWGVARQADVESAVADRPSITAEQADMVRRVCTAGAAVEPVVGAAGTGKTFALDAARQAWETSGIGVVGATLSARAAAELRVGSGIAATTLAGLTQRLDSGQLVLDDQSVVVVDEAGMVGTRALDQLVGQTTAARAKLVLVGDHHQLAEINAGGSFRALATALHAVELNDNRRQQSTWERDALGTLRTGRVFEAVAAYDANRRIVSLDNAEALRQRLVDDWWDARSEGDDALMIARRRSDVRDLNDRARNLRDVAGELGAVRLVAAGREFAEGDEVLAVSRNHYDLDILNGDLGVVTSIDPADRSITFLNQRVGDERTMPASWLEAGHLDHGYARSNHKTQGSTVDRAFVLGEDGDLDRQSAYSALSRGRLENRLYMLEPDEDLQALVDAEPVPVLAHVERELSRDRAQQQALEQIEIDLTHGEPIVRPRPLEPEMGFDVDL